MIARIASRPCRRDARDLIACSSAEILAFFIFVITLPSTLLSYSEGTVKSIPNLQGGASTQLVFFAGARNSYHLAPHTMSSVLQKLRIIAIPLTRPNATRTPITTPSRLVYYQFQITVPRPKPPPSPLKGGDQESETDAKKKGWLPEEGIVKWATNKAVDIWAGFGKKKSGWQVRSIERFLLLHCRMRWFLGFCFS